MRYDFEIPIAQLFADYLNAQCAVQPGGILDAGQCAIVTFFDPMSIDDADRVIIQAPDGECKAEAQGNFTATIQVTQKTAWTETGLADQMKIHFARVNEVRDKFFARNIVALMAGIIPAGLALNYVQPKKKFSTNVYDSGWIESTATIQAEGYFTA